PTSSLYTLSLHDALPICSRSLRHSRCLCHKAYRVPCTTLADEPIPPLSPQLLEYSFLLLPESPLISAESFQFIERALPALSVTIARFFTRQLFVRQPHLGATVTIG